MRKSYIRDSQIWWRPVGDPDRQTSNIKPYDGHADVATSKIPAVHKASVIESLSKDYVNFSKRVKHYAGNTTSAMEAFDTITSASMTRANCALEMWQEIKSIRDESGDVPAESLQRIAQSYSERFSSYNKNQRSIVERNMLGFSLHHPQRNKINSFSAISLIPSEDLLSNLRLIIGGNRRGRVEFLVEGAALVFLGGLSTQLAFISNVCRHRCTVPLARLLEGVRLAENDGQVVRSLNKLRLRWPTLQEELEVAKFLFERLNKLQSNQFAQLVREEGEIYPASMAVVSSVKHLFNNKLTTTSFLKMVESNIEDLTQIVGRDSLDEAIDDIRAWDDAVDLMGLVPFSDEEPISYIGRRFPVVELISEGAIPLGLNSRILNVIAAQFVLNAMVHPHPRRSSMIGLHQSEQGIAVQDNGTGISVSRLLELREKISSGQMVRTDHKGGTGMGIRDSVVLLHKLAVSSAAITLSSKKGEGAIASVSWGADSTSTCLRNLPSRWHWLQFKVNDYKNPTNSFIRVQSSFR